MSGSEKAPGERSAADGTHHPGRPGRDPLAGLGPRARPAVLALGAVALVCLLLSLLPASTLSAVWTTRVRDAGLALLLGAPWVLVAAVGVAAVRRRAWGWSLVAAALLGLFALAWWSL